MVKHIGIRHRGLPTLSELLFFDQIAVIAPPRSPSTALKNFFQIDWVARNLGEFKAPASEETRIFDMLDSMNIVTEIDALLPDDKKNTFNNLLNQFGETVIRALDALESSKKQRNRVITDLRKSAPELFEDASGNLFMEKRLAAPLRKLVAECNDAVVASIIPDNTLAVSVPGGVPLAYANDEAIRVVLKKFPTLDSFSDFEDFQKLQEFRQNEQAIEQRRQLRKLMRRLSQEPGTHRFQIEDQIDELLAEYSTSMKKAKMRFTLKAVSFVLSACRSVIEAIQEQPNLNPLGKSLELFSSHLELTADERAIPGAEVAFIANAHEMFCGG